jgi:hypothetical protein
MHRLFFLSIVIMAFITSSVSPSAEAQSRSEKRCGWFSSPTPANAWLIDKDGEWTIGIQGGYQAKGDWPETGQWVETNVHYGYGCTCAQVRTNKRSFTVLEVISSTPRPLSACRRDPALKRKEPK